MVGRARVQRLRDSDAAHVWHPYTQMLEYAASDPVIIERGLGPKLQDIEGRWYWDGVSSIWLNVHGHRVPQIDRAIQRQLERVAHSTLLGQGNAMAAEFAGELVKVLPAGLDHVFYTDNGSCANEAAIKMALQHWIREGRPDKRRVVSFQDGYHGDTLGTVGVAPVPAFHSDFAPLLPPAYQVPYPDCYRGPGDHPQNCVAAHLEPVAQALEQGADATAALIVEPVVQGVGGIRVMPDGFMSGLRRLCDRHDVLLIADEVATGFGRTGKMWACDHDGVRPDILTMGKGITGGYLPLAATVAADEIYASFLGAYADRRTLFHGHSYTGNALACAAALANLELMPAALARLPELAAAMQRGLAPLRELDIVGDVRHKGLMAGVELVSDRIHKTPFPWQSRAAWVAADLARANGLLVRPIGNVSILMPPLGSTVEELETMTGLFVQAHQDAAPRLRRLAQAHVAA